jgi:hypothetical protein
LEVGAEGEFKLDLRLDCDPGKQELKGAVRTETYWRHYCQHSSLFCLRKGGVVFALASSRSKQCWDAEPHDGIHPDSKNEDFLFPEVDEGPLQPQVVKSLKPILQPLHGGYQPTILAIWRGWYPWRYNWLNF